MKAAHTFEDIVAGGWAPSVRYLEIRARRGEIKARKVARVWKMTDEDLDSYIESLANVEPPQALDEPADVHTLASGVRLTPESMRRRAS